MRIFIPLLIITTFFVSCSFKEEPNAWQYKSANYFKEYQKNFLSNKVILAKSDLEYAVANAKQSANLNTLAKIYLGKCALNISVGIEDSCTDYQEVSLLLADKKLDAYYHFILKSNTFEDIEYLEDNYEKFARLIKSQKFIEASDYIFEMKRASSTLLSGALMKDDLNDFSREKLLNLASYHGYKKAALFWLREQKKHTKSIEKVKIIDKKIRILSK